MPQSMPGNWKNIPKWLFDPEGPVSVHAKYMPKFLPWAIKFLRAANETGLPAIGDAMSALNRPNVDLYRRHLDGTGSEHLVADSLYVHVFRDASAADLNKLAWRMRSERGTPMEAVNEGELQELEPALGPDYKAAILLKDQARALDPGAIGRVLFEKAMAMGAKFRQANIQGIVTAAEGGWNADTDVGLVHGDKLVLAAGAWSAQLLVPLGIKVPLEAERGYHLIFREPGVKLNNSIMEHDGKFVASSMADGVRTAGTAEFAGVNAAPDYRRARVLAPLTKQLLPGLNTTDTVEWMGRRPSFPDSLPCLGELPGYPGLIAAFGHSHYGFGMAPQTGRVIAEIVTGAAPNIDMTPYRIDRF